MTVALPKATSGGYITGITLDLFKTFSFKGKKRSFISATCPAWVRASLLPRVAIRSVNSTCVGAAL